MSHTAAHLYLVTGTDGVVMIWDMTTGEALYALEDVFGGPISALALIEGPADDSQHPAFCYGNAAGHLALCTYVETEVCLFACTITMLYWNSPRIPTA